MKRVLFDKFHKTDCESILEESDSTYLEVFSIGFRLSAFLRGISFDDQVNFRDTMRKVFKRFNEMYPEEGLDEHKGLQLIENIYHERPGSATEFAERISPHKILTNVFLKLKEVL